MIHSSIVRAKKVQKRIDEIASCSDDDHGISRTFGTAAFRDCSKKIAAWMEEIGLQTRTDNMGNIRGRLLSNNPVAKTFVLASHFDSVINAGKYDGPLGILAALSVVENIIAQKVSLPFHIEVIAFSEEEGVRFHTTYLGSKVVAGSFNNDLLEAKDENEHTLQDVLTDLKFDSKAIPKDAIPQEDWLGYYEIHIEQGPVLYDRNVPAGVVSSIAGQKRIEIEFIGEAGHAGTVPMNMRRDALCAAAQFISEVETYVSRERRSIVATVGKLNVVNGASNVIPGKVACTLDIRSSDAELLSDAYEKINKICEEICYKRHTYFEWNLVQESDPILCDENLKNLLSQSVKNKNIELIDLPSGAGHDAVIISSVAPIIMLFVKCFKGISHNPLENVEIEDIAAALEISDDFIRELAKHQPAVQ